MSHARSRLRSDRTKLATARSAFRALARQGHLVGTVTGPLPVGPAKERREELAAFIRSPRRPPFAEREVMEYPRLPPSVRLDAGEPHHLAPLLGFLDDQLVEVSGRTRKHRATEVCKPRFHRWDRRGQR